MKGNADTPRLALGNPVPWRRPLAPAERDEAAALGSRLVAELRLLVAALPEPARTVRGMTDHLGVDRNACQRLLAAIKVQHDGLAAMLRFPGVQGLQVVVAAARAMGVDQEAVAAADAAVKQFAALVMQNGGSHAKLRSRIEGTIRAECAGQCGNAGPAAAHEIALRRRLYAGAVELASKHMDLQLSLSIVRPLPDDPSRIERAGASGFIGQCMRPGTAPFTAMVAHSSDRAEGGNSSIRYTDLESASSGTVIEEFSTMPLPLVTTRGPSSVGAGGLVHVIDPAALQGEETLDVVLGHRMTPVSHPAHHETAAMNLLSRVRTPARRLLFDVYLDRTLAKSSVPSVGVYLSLPAPGSDATPRWYERLPSPVDMRVLGSGVKGAESEAWVSSGDLTRFLFERLGWPADSFIGYRCDVLFPIWGATYMMSFDFSDESETT